MTNLERIKGMIAKELAGIVGFLFCSNSSVNVECPYYKTRPSNNDEDIYESCSDRCQKAFLQWLKQEVEEC